MTDAKKDAKKYYLKFIPKEELTGFMERLKTALATGQKSGEKKEFELEIRGSKEDPKGISIENYTLDKAKFAEFFDVNAEHTKKALVLCTINFEIKDEKDVDLIKTSFETIKNMVMAMPMITAKGDKFELHLRNNGKKFGIDFISKEGKIVQALLDLGVNLSEYHSFCFALKTGADLGKIFTQGAAPSPELISEIFNILISLKSTGENVKYLATALSAALKDVKLDDEKKQKKLTKFLGFLNLINTFIAGKIKLEFDSKVLKAEGDKAVANLPGGADAVKQQIAGMHAMAIGSGKQFVKPMVEGMGFGPALQAINLDRIAVAGGVPKYENGFAFVLTIPGLSQVLEEMLK